MAKCEHPDSIYMKLVDGEPVDDNHTMWIFKCELCGNIEKIVEKHERIL